MSDQREYPSIPEPCRDYIKAFGNNSSIRQSFLELFDALAQESGFRGLPANSITVPCFDMDNPPDLNDGDWVPEIHLVIRKVADATSDDADGERGPDDEEANEACDQRQILLAERGLDPVGQKYVQGS